ncbi:alpha/beta hydrolase [Paraglaciecola psychrophila]|uniref:Phospholipase/Carboxylesterase n=1 Tax=Paraglaciecola psychrophila 170 TaxID=1129794 RepID=K6Z3P5_9ALTE|nr:alpha/beta fold hydrolase [Paraglaciecola psychrophila]AGH43575.1 phospholipase/Carboxylesterase [Paraglaciecola psychrophila 170]GAC39684.1 phospholipase/Carboxylesterase [Paraglaciecola psychrophila 170]
MKFLLLLLIFASITTVFSVSSQPVEDKFDRFDAIYQAQLGTTRGCQTPDANMFKVCSDSLKNDGNAPYILHHNKVTEKVVVLFHGLSDSPFYLRSIAQSIHQQGINVIVALMPGHGKNHADEDMQDDKLADRWRAHVSDLVEYAASLGEQRYLGGFSTGGVLATEYILQHPEAAKGLVLFSGALALDSSVESIANIWGIQWLAKLLDGEYATQGPNPYKYPSVGRFSAFKLTEVIFSVRDLIEQGVTLNLPIFSAHSMADITTPIIGVKDLMAANKGPNSLFEISLDVDVCHADVVINQEQLSDMHYDASLLEDILPCEVPKVNPKHADMLDFLSQFLTTY